MSFLSKVIKLMDGTEPLIGGEHCKQISMLDDRYSEDIFLLILQFFCENNKGFKATLLEGKDIPYNGKLISKEGKGLTYKISALPEDLQRILVRYLLYISQ